MNYCKPSFPVLYHLPEFAQIHVHGFGDASNHLILSPLLLLLLVSQHYDLYQPVSSLYQVTEVLELQLQHQCFQ